MPDIDSGIVGGREQLRYGMKKDDNAQYWYGIGMVFIFLLFFGFVVYLVYTLIAKVANNEFSNVALIQSIGSLFFTVVIGTILSKKLDKHNARQAEIHKIKVDVAEKFVLIGTILLMDHDNEEANKNYALLQVRAKLFFKDEVLVQMNQFMTTKAQTEFDSIVELMRKEIV